jgi:aminoglycoside 6'-N-acetyltransferase I
MTVHYRILGPHDLHVLSNVAPGLFDRDVQPEFVGELLADARHRIVVAIDSERVVGFVTAVHYVNPDKPAELWINEVAVAPDYRQQGIGRGMLQSVLRVARELQCASAWVLTDTSNGPAMRLYGSSGGVASDLDVVMFEFALGATGEPTPP